ncbi:rhamnogalacturonidase [Edaphobacter dinghuensis]|uniref:Exo-poly-alpha-D-galacturonosidase n=1 Tax=Edaphobacter dinghuensis TaxID=1560005 RepID=A0A917H210_9BACT|nr:glycoside hydrolase family 28 protein [Edaphobacter dinghuensis]GGG64713.1 exo-poly-alpha-D-galacturonosidase [Edaphobacter dinghuensis]
MDTFSSARRDLLKFGGMGLAAAAATLPSYAATKPTLHSSSGVFDVRTYGATGDGKTVDTPAINRAIEAAAAAGGGTVIFPAGTYLCFSIHLKSYVDLFLSQGATILAADSPLPGQTTGYNGGTYDAAEPKTSYDAFQDYGHNHWHNSLIWGEDIHDFSITGPGLIYGKGLSFGAGPGRPPGAPPRPAGVVPRAYVPRKRGDYPMYQAEQAGVGNKAIALKNCRNVIFRDFSILKGGHFGLLLTGVDNLTIDNLKIDTDRDGMDIDCCKNVRVSNCTVNSPWDDGICPKSSFALGYNRATENLTITNCFVTGTYELGTVLDGTWKKFADDAHVYRTGRIKCGTESNGGFKNITISNCVFEGCHGLALESEDGALCEDITITNITQRDVYESPIFFRLGARLRGPKGTGNQSTVVGTLQRVLVDNFVSYNNDSKVCSILSGIPGYAIKDIKLSNIYIQHQGGDYASQVNIVPPEEVEKYPDPGMFGPMPAQGFFFRHVNNLELSHVEVSPMKADPRPSFSLQEVNRADFIAVTAPTNPPAFHLNKVTDLRILLSRAAKDTQVDSADDKTL